MKEQCTLQKMNNNVVNADVTCNTVEKRMALEQCDDAFTLSVVKREGFEGLFEKIDSNADFIIARQGRECLGFAAMYANDFENRSAYITLFAVRQNYQKRHIGTLLMKKCIDVAEKKGMKEIRLEVLKRDAGPISFYQKMGFQYETDVCRESKKSIYMKCNFAMESKVTQDIGDNIL